MVRAWLIIIIYNRYTFTVSILIFRNLTGVNIRKGAYPPVNSAIKAKLRKMLSTDLEFYNFIKKKFQMVKKDLNVW